MTDSFLRVTHTYGRNGEQMSAEGGTKAIVAALLANTGIAVSKFIAAAITGSASMLAEGVHSVADASNQVLLLIGGKAARKAASPAHPFGYGRERYIYAFIVSIVLFSIGGVYALYEGFHKMAERDDHHGLENPLVAVVVLVLAIILESFSLRTAVKESNHVRGKQSWVQFIKGSRSPELPVILLEDIGALVGLILALFGVGLSWITGDILFDALGTMSIGVLLVLIAIVLAIEIRSMLIGESATLEDIDAIKAAINDGADSTLIHLKTLHVGPDELLVAAKVGIGVSATGEQVASEIDAAEARIRAAVPKAKIIYIEPDIPRTGA
jgi:cation diffusion facilitator family transporter